MEKNNLEKLENLMWKEYKKQISFQQVQKEFLKNDDERIEYIKTELEKAYNEKNGHSVDILISAIYMFKLYSEKFVDILCKMAWKTRRYSVLSSENGITFYNRLYIRTSNFKF